ncbi:MAG: ABC transporter permease, partial [Bacilli bacterium]|nr:ABC transporter permease [Bacilli bacterium]
VFSNTRFDSKKKNNLNFEDLISVDTKMLQSAFKMDISEDDIKNMTAGYMEEISSSITTDIKPAKELVTTSFTSLAKGVLKYALNNPTNTLNMGDTTVKVIATYDVARIVEEYLNTDEATKIFKKLESEYIVPASVYKTSSSSLLNGLLQSYIMASYQTNPSLTTDPKNPVAIIDESAINPTVENFMKQAVIIATCEKLANSMVEAKMKSNILTKVGELTTKLMTSISSSFNVDSNKIASAFKFDLSDKELSRLMGAMNNTSDANQHSNLINLGYQDLEDPTAISVTFYSFEAKENFLDFIDRYNEDVKKNNEEDKVIRYTDTMGILMSSVKKIVDSVSYVLIAFVSIALIVSSIMIGIITYISVLERTKEIGILRAIGASKHNISSIFNAETFIIGLLSGLIGIGFTLAVIPIINNIIHNVTNNLNINASIPIVAAIILIILSVILTLIGGLIPSRMASKKDPVEALRTE